jgi:hypothetical protein
MGLLKVLALGNDFVELLSKTYGLHSISSFYDLIFTFKGYSSMVGVC